jgi:hypothetical protein
LIVRLAYYARLLQWGHAFVSVETSFDAYVWQTLHTLQWGHAFVSVETADAQLLILRA